jgi:hypothetical protein
VEWAVRLEREKTVTDLAWTVAMRGRVGWALEDQARSWRSGVNVGRARMRLLLLSFGSAEVGMVGDCLEGTCSRVFRVW